MDGSIFVLIGGWGMKIHPMKKDFLLFRCLHSGALRPSTIDEECSLSKEQSDRNKKFLTRVIDSYGSCAMLAVDGESVVAHARFYPQVIYDRFKFCCQDPNHAITQEIAEMKFPRLANQAERDLRITCYFVLEDYRGQGLSHKLIAAVIEWGKNNGWKSVRCLATRNNYWLSSEMCTPMLRTYVKHGFKIIGTVAIPEVKGYLQKMKDGEFGVEKKRGFEKFCAGEDLSELVSFYEMECML